MLIRSRSNLGAFVRSRLGVKGPSDFLLQADGQGDALMSISATETSVAPFTGFWQFRRDNPYGVMQSLSTPVNASSVPAQIGGKLDSSDGTLHRGRFGFSFHMPNLAGLTYAYLSLNMQNWQNAIETFVPEVWASFGDDSAINSGWFFNLNRLCGDGVYGTSGIQRIDLQIGSITPRSNATLSIVLGENKELNDTGVGAITRQNIEAAFSIDFTTCGITLGF